MVAGHPPRGRPPLPPRHAAPTGHASQGDSAGPPHTHICTHSTWVAGPDSPPGGRAVGGGGAPDRRRRQTPLRSANVTPPTNALPPPPQRATPARNGARCGAGAGSPRPHRPHPGHTGRGTPTARPRGPAAGGGTAPDTRRPPVQWQACSPGGGPPPPLRYAAPTGHASQGDSAGPPHPHTRAHNTWAADPDSQPRGRAFGGGGAPGQTPFTTVKGALPGDAPPPPPQRATPVRKGPRCRAGARSPRPHPPHPGNTDRGTPAARLRGWEAGGGTEPDTRRPSQRWQATTPGDGPPQPPRYAAPTGRASQGDSVELPQPHTRAHSTWVADPDSPPSGRSVGGGGAPDLRRPSPRRKAPFPGYAPPPSPR